MSTTPTAERTAEAIEPVITFRVTRLQQHALETATDGGVLCDPDIEAVRSILDQITTPASIHRLLDGGPVSIVLPADEAASVAGAVSAARDAYRARDALNHVQRSGIIRCRATLTVLCKRILDAKPYPCALIAPESEAR